MSMGFVYDNDSMENHMLTFLRSLFFVLHWREVVNCQLTWVFSTCHSRHYLLYFTTHVLIVLKASISICIIIWWISFWLVFVNQYADGILMRNVFRWGDCHFNDNNNIMISTIDSHSGLGFRNYVCGENWELISYIMEKCLALNQICSDANNNKNLLGI